MSVAEVFSHLVGKVRGWLPFLRQSTALTPPPEPRVPIKRSRARKEDRAENYGAFYYFDDVLDRLDSYFKYLGHLKRDDPDSFDLYSRVGGQIVGRRALFEHWDLPPGWLQNRPAFAMVHFVDDETGSTRITPKLLYFQKFKGHANLQPIHGDIYRVVMYYVDADKPKYRMPAVFHVHVSTDGGVALLKERISEPVTIRHKRGGTTTISRQTWAVPDALMYVLGENKEKLRNEGCDTPSQAAAQLFRLIVSMTYNATDGVRVNVQKGRMTGVFNVAMERTAYFFKNRDKTVNENGATKRIFHITRAHTRTYASGKTVPVRLHFKGERVFTWKGYRVNITVSGKHHFDLNELNVGAIDATEVNDQSHHLTMREVGDIVKRRIGE